MNSRHDDTPAKSIAHKLLFAGVGILITGVAIACLTPSTADLLALSHPDPDFIYQSTHHEHATSAVSYSIEGGAECIEGIADIYPCSNVDMLGFISLTELGGGSGSDSWGWMDPLTGVEYALVGRSTGVTFVNISNPELMQIVGILPRGDTATVWADIKVFADHAFIVADNVQNTGIQIFDLRRLRDAENAPVTFTPDAVYSGFTAAHNLAINEDSGFAYAVGGPTCSQGIHMVDIGSPTQPVFAGCINNLGFIHDVQCLMYSGPDAEHQGKEICIASGMSRVKVLDVSDKNNPVLLSENSYGLAPFTHQGWLTPDQRYFIFGDELDERGDLASSRTRTLVMDLTDLDDGNFVGSFQHQTSSTDHNQYVVGKLVYQANYTAGLRVLRLDDPASAAMSQVAFFDTFPANDLVGFHGAWNVYPFFDSGKILVSDFSRGLFVLRANIDDDGNPVQSGVTIQPGHSGTYDAPDRDGEGLIVEVLDRERAVVLWFTYPPAGSNAGTQAWLGGVGQIMGDRIIVENARIATGAKFGDEFDPADVQRVPWGSLELQFSDCANARLNYDGPPAYGQDSRMVRRISAIEHLDCMDATDESVMPVSSAPGISGQWFDPASDGQGWFLQEVAPGRVLVAWFSFDAQRHQAWMIGVGDLNASKVLQVDNMRRPSGTSFGDDFNSSDIIRQDWGSLRIEFHNCNEANLQFASPLTDFGVGTAQPIRLTRLSGLACSFDDPVDPL